MESVDNTSIVSKSELIETLGEPVPTQCRTAFDKAGYWPNQVMWKAWETAWMQATAIERKRCAELAECYTVEINDPVDGCKTVLKCGRTIAEAIIAPD
jgi:hypothetical protein